MLKKFLQQLKFKAMARQLRKPSGPAGKKTGKLMNKANAFLYDFIISCMQPAPGNAILEIGFGNGNFFSKIYSSAQNLQLTGLDFSATMVQAATAGNKELIAAGKLHLHTGSSDAMPFPDNSFDLIFCINVVYFWDTPGTHLQEVRRVLKPGGKFYAVIRTKESMELMPFTRYGFTSYTEESWKRLVEENRLHFQSCLTVNEPPVEFEGNPFQIRSLCLVAEKPV